MNNMKQLLSLICFIVLMSFTSCNNRVKEETPSSLAKQCEEALHRLDYTKLDTLSKKLLDKVKQNSDDEQLAYAYYFNSVYRPGLTNQQEAYRRQMLEKAYNIAIQKNYDALLCRIYNTMGAYELGKRKYYYTAQYYFKKAVDIARRTGNSDMEALIEMNMSEVYRFLNDTLGWQYDSQLFEYAQKSGNASMLFSSGLHCARYVLKRAKDTTELRPYIEAMQRVGLFSDVIQMLYAEYYYYHGQYQKAEFYIKKTNPQKYQDFTIIQAKIYNKLGNYSLSNNIATSMLDKAPSSVWDGTQLEALRLLSENSHILKDFYNEALCLKIYSHKKDSIAEVRSKDKLQLYKIEYEVGKKNQEIQARAHRETILKLAVAFTLLLLTATTAFYIYYIRRRNALYRKIVRQNKQYMGTISEMKARMEKVECKPEELTERNNANKKNEIAKPDNAVRKKADEVFKRIIYEMERKQLWRDSLMDREHFADIVGCNRTDFSNIIKRKTGLSYTAFINSYRIQEAIRRLTDGDQEPLKFISEQIGFTTIQTFYTSFKQITGMSPAAYRNTVCKIEK